MRFINREDAAQQLAVPLQAYKNSDAIILSVPRGGVPIGKILSERLGLPHDIILTKKIGHPSNPELAIGWVTSEDWELDASFGHIPRNYIEGEVKRIQQELHRRQLLFHTKRKILSVDNKTVILTDDGIATGNTLLAAIRMLRNAGVKNIIVAVPVAPLDMVGSFKKQADLFICLYQAPDFRGVGQFYENFPQVSDEEVLQLLS